MPDTNYTALAAECEKKAEQGEKPVMEWVIEKEYRATLNQADKECVLYSNGWRVRSRMTGHTYFSDVLLHCLPAAQLFAEALLRDATKLLHQGVYNELATTKDMLNTTHGQIFDMCEHLGVKREDEPCDAWALRDAILKMEQSNDDLCTALCHATDQRMSKPGYTVDAMMSEIDDVRQRAIDKETAALRAENQRLAGEVSRSREMLDSMNSDFHHLQANADTVCAALNELRAENQRLRTALDGLIDGARIAWRDLLECAQVANSHVQVSEGNPEFPAARLFHRAGLERTEEVMLILGKATETARAALSQEAPTAATPDPSKEA